ncbi:hypothetical protein MRX96_035717 [Rhipicephalus microplus]
MARRRRTSLAATGRRGERPIRMISSEREGGGLEGGGIQPNARVTLRLSPSARHSLPLSLFAANCPQCVYHSPPLSLCRIQRVQSRTQNLAYRMMLNQTDLMATHESPFSTDEQFMYEPTEEDKNAYCNLQPIGLDGADHVTPSLQHMDLMAPSRPIPFEGDTFPTDVLDLGESRWQSLPIQHWQSHDVLEWLVAWTSHNQVEIVDDEINMTAFASFTGEHLCRMSLDEFRAHAPSYGHRLYEEVQRHLGNSTAAAAASRNMGMSDAYFEPEKYAFHPRYFDTLEIQNSSPGSENVTSSGSPGLAESDSGSTSSSLSTVNERTENLFPYMPHDTRILKQMAPPMPMIGKKKGRRGRPPHQRGQSAQPSRQRHGQAVGVHPGPAVEPIDQPEPDTMGEARGWHLQVRPIRQGRQDVGRPQAEPSHDLREAQPGHEILLQKPGPSTRVRPAACVQIRPQRHWVETVMPR